MDDGQEIKTSELRYRRLFEAAQDGILILDARTGSITDVNPFLIRMLGYSREEFIQKKLWEVGAFQDIEASREAFKALQVDEYIRYEDMMRAMKSCVNWAPCCSSISAERIFPAATGAMNSF